MCGGIFNLSLYHKFTVGRKNERILKNPANPAGISIKCGCSYCNMHRASMPGHKKDMHLYDTVRDIIQYNIIRIRVRYKNCTSSYSRTGTIFVPKSYPNRIVLVTMVLL